MPLLVFGIIALSLVIAAIAVDKSRKKRRTARRGKPDYTRHIPPAGLGLQPEVPLESAESRLEEGLGAEFVGRLRERVLQKHLGMSAAEFNWKLFEMKRYFMMTAVLKNVPMYSESVDDIWHEMLMFTREYQRFGETFIGAAIHHAPHSAGESAPNPGERAWFDWVYSHLFTATPYTGAIWKSFYRQPLDKSRIEELRLVSAETLASRYFNTRNAERYPEIRETISYLIARAKEQIARAVQDEEYEVQRPAHGAAGFLPYMAGAMMFHSVADPSEYEYEMEQYGLEEEQKKAAAAGSSCSTSSYGCGGWNENCADNGSGDGGSGSGTTGGGGGSSGDGGSGSSCSSSSCSSSSCGGGCGGGGD